MRKENRKFLAGLAMAIGVSLGVQMSSVSAATVDIYHPVKMGSYKNAQDAANTGEFLDGGSASDDVRILVMGTEKEFSSEDVLSPVVDVYHPVKMGSYKNAQDAANTGEFPPGGSASDSMHILVMGTEKTFVGEDALSPVVDVYHPVKMGSYKNVQDAANTGIFSKQ